MRGMEFSLCEQIAELRQVAKMESRSLNGRQLKSCNQIADERQLHFERNQKYECDPFWDEFNKRIDDWEQSCLSWHLRIRKKVVWLVRKIVQRRRQIVEAHDDEEVPFGFHEQMDESDMEIAEQLVVDNEIADGEVEEYLHTNEDLELLVTIVVDLGLHVVYVTNLNVARDKKMNLIVADTIFIWEDFTVADCKDMLHGYTVGLVVILVFEGMK